MTPQALLQGLQRCPTDALLLVELRRCESMFPDNVQVVKIPIFFSSRIAVYFVTRAIELRAEPCD